MKTYIVISHGGFTQDDALNEVQNCQVIGVFCAQSSYEAKEKAWNKIKRLEWCFDFNELVAYQLDYSVKI